MLYPPPPLPGMIRVRIPPPPHTWCRALEKICLQFQPVIHIKHLLYSNMFHGKGSLSVILYPERD